MIDLNSQNRELTTNALDIVSGGGLLKSQGDLKGALTKLEKEIKNREKSL